LLEVLVAVVAGSVTVFTAMQVAAVTMKAARLGVEVAKQHDERILALRRLRRLLESSEPPRDSARFEGESSRVRYTGSHRADNAGFMSEPLELRHQGQALQLLTRTGRVLFTTPAESVTVEYLTARGRHAPFIAAWSSGAGLPMALRVRLWHGAARGAPVVDTLLVRTGGS